MLIKLLFFVFHFRTLSFIKSSFDSNVPEVILTANDKIFLARITQELRSYIDCLENQKIRDGIKHILSISRLGNGHIQAHKPWEMIKGSPDQKYYFVFYFCYCCK